MIYKQFFKRYTDIFGQRILLQLSEDDLKCRCCHSKKQIDLTVHHILPRSEGGTDMIRNLIVLCNSCHDKVELKELSYEQYSNGYLRPRPCGKGKSKIKMYKLEGDNFIFVGERYE